MEDTTSTAVVETPVTTPSAPTGEPSAPAAPSTPSRPASMKEALAQTAAKRAANEDTATTAPPASPDGSPALTKKGPIPFEVHETTLRNAREKTAAERDADWESRVGWAKALDRKRAEESLQLAEMLDRDPAIFIDRAIAAMAADPERAPAIRSILGRYLGTRSAHAEPTAELTPIPVQLEDGRVINVLPADQLAIFEKQVLAKASEQFKPAMQAAQELQQAKEFAVKQHQAGQFASGFLSELTRLPQFKEHAAEIKAELAKTTLETDHPAEVRAATLAIYNRIVLPKLSQAGAASAMASLKQKAAAQVERVSGGAPSPTTRPRNPKELAKFLEQKAAARKAAG